MYVLNVEQKDSPYYTRKVLYNGELRALKSRLDIERNKMDKYPDKKQLHRYIMKHYEYDSLKYQLRESLGKKYITNAWLKTYELFKKFKLVGNVFFNANAPGTSSDAYLQYIKDEAIETPIDWVASTYVPTTEKGSTLGDTYGLIKETKSHWLMNDYNNGDTTKVDNILDFAIQIRARFNKLCDIYFSDIAIDVGEDYNNEELLEAKEVLGQNIAGLYCLDRGGVYITKQRGLFLPLSIWFVSLLYDLFDVVYITKPETSKPFNSEIYIVGLVYRGISKDLMDTLFSTLVSYNNKSTPYRLRTPVRVDLYENIYNIIRNITETQIASIKKLNL